MCQNYRYKRRRESMVCTWSMTRSGSEKVDVLLVVVVVVVVVGCRRRRVCRRCVCRRVV